VLSKRFQTTRVELTQLANISSAMAKPGSRDEHWADLVSQWRASGLSQREFCRRRGISDRALNSWLCKSPYRERVARILAARSQGDCTAETPRFLPVSVLTATGASDAQPVGAAIEVVLKSGPRIAVTPGFDAETLRRVVAALEG
jgi:lambda repressor-like predicted transcriptional regulator